jgi:hypothetical protein
LFWAVRDAASYTEERSWRSLSPTSGTYVGLDMHRYAIAVVVAEAVNHGKVPEHGKISNTPAALRPLIRRLGHAGSNCDHVTIPVVSAITSDANAPKRYGDVPLRSRHIFHEAG